MRREQRKNNHKTNSNTIFYISGGVLAAAIIAFIIAFVVYANRLNTDTSDFTQYLASTDNMAAENTTSASSKIGKTVEEAENMVNNTTTTNEVVSEENKTIASQVTKKAESKNKSATSKKKTEPQKDPTFKSPIEKASITKEYAKDSLVYSETLKEWTTHLGVDIKAEKGTEVKAASEGTVKSIKNDPRYGLTIIIEHSNGYKTVYANLLTTELVSEGEKIKQGQTIGTVGDTAVYEVVDEPHLHFEIIKNNENVNPSDYIKF